MEELVSLRSLNMDTPSIIFFNHHFANGQLRQTDGLFFHDSMVESILQKGESHFHSFSNILINDMSNRCSSTLMAFHTARLNYKSHGTFIEVCSSHLICDG